MSSTNPLPPEILEQRAAEQRRRLHETVTELRTTVRGTVREKLDVKKNAREYILPASAALGLMGLVFGYGFAGMFTRR